MQVFAKRLAVALLACTAGAGAQAANFSFNYDPFYFGGGIDAVMVDRPPMLIDDGKAGAFHGTLTGAPGYSLLTSASPFMTGVGFTFCVELTQQVVFGLNPSYSVLDPATSAYASWGANAAGISNHLDRLMSLAMPSLASAPDAATLNVRLASLQLSIWEVIYDYSPSYAYSLTGGVLKFATAPELLAQSALWLGAPAMSTAVPTAHYAVLHDNISQDLLVVSTTPVPEPATWALMGFGLWCLAMLKKRLPQSAKFSRPAQRRRA